MRRFRIPIRLALLASALSVVFLVGLPVVASAAGSPPADLAVVFVNGMGSDNAQVMNVASVPENESMQLSMYYNKAKAEGYNTFVICSRPDAYKLKRTSTQFLIDSTSGSPEYNAKQLAGFLRQLRSARGIRTVVLVAHSYGGIISREFIESEYSPTDASLPLVAKLITIGTPHGGWHPDAISKTAEIYALGKLVGFNVASAADYLTPEYLQPMNEYSDSNSQVPYVLIGGAAIPKWDTLRRKGGLAAWDHVWSVDGAWIMSDALVHTPSALGYYITGASSGQSIFSSGAHAVREIFVNDHFHGYNSTGARYFGITPQTSLTFDPSIYTEYIGPELVEAAYLAATSKFDISQIPNGTSVSSITDGVMTASFVPATTKGSVPGSWATWSTPPYSESGTPDVLISSAGSLTMSLSAPVSTLGFEIEGNVFAPADFTCVFKLSADGTTVDTVLKTIHGQAGARLISLDSAQPFDAVDIQCTDSSGFAVAQIRYR